MLWNYITDATEKSLHSAKNVFWFGKAIFLLLYIAFCFAISISFLDYGVAVALLLFAATDFLIFVVKFFLSYFKNNFYISKFKRNFAGVLGVLKVIVRLTDSVLLFTLAVIIVDKQLVLSQSLSTIILIFSCILLVFIFSQEIVSTCFKYLKYRATHNFRKISQVLQNELLQHSDKELIEEDK